MTYNEGHYLQQSQVMRKFEEAIIHKDDSDIPAHDDISVVKGWHTSPDPNDPSKPWKDVGYHFYIKSDGTLQYGRALHEVGSHARGRNRNSIGICLHGKNHFTREQFKTLADLVFDIFKIMNISKVRGHGFYDKNKKHCPGFDVYGQIKLWRPDIVIT